MDRDEPVLYIRTAPHLERGAEQDSHFALTHFGVYEKVFRFIMSRVFQMFFLFHVFMELQLKFCYTDMATLGIVIIRISNDDMARRCIADCLHYQMSY